MTVHAGVAIVWAEGVRASMPKIDYEKLQSCDAEKLLALEQEVDRNARRELEQKRLAEEEALRKKRKKRKRKLIRS